MTMMTAFMLRLIEVCFRRKKFTLRADFYFILDAIAFMMPEVRIVVIPGPQNIALRLFTSISIYCSRSGIL